MVGRRGDSGGEIESIIGGGSAFVGDLTFSGQVRLDGVIEGSIRSKGDDTSQLVIGPQGVVKGDVDVPNVIAGGRVEGSLKASKTLKVLSEGRIQGDATYGSLEVMSGALVEGQLKSSGKSAADGSPGIVKASKGS